jgi:hypothetical protein
LTVLFRTDSDPLSTQARPSLRDSAVPSAGSPA